MRITTALLFALFMVVAAETSGASRPSLVVVICLDQFPHDYLVRFREHFGPDGFNYLLGNGAVFSNATYQHATNKTGPGHAAILSGSYADQNGIIANNWFDRSTGRNMNCVADSTARLVGGSGYGRSPVNFTGSTFGDVLRLHTSFRSKVISLSGKDRGAILPGGKLANAAFWMHDSLFVSSSYYMNELPAWVSDFNSSGMINSYFGRTWEKTLPDEAYASQDSDDVPYESGRNGLGVTFPHHIVGDDASKITRSFYHALLTSPYGDEFLAEFAKQAIRGEKLGTRGVPDLLCISFSASDYVGHAFGPHSQEVLDMAVRTDRMLADLFADIDREIGLRNCVVVLTSDHGVAPIPEYLLKHRPDAQSGRVDYPAIEGYVASAMTGAFGPLKKGGRWHDRVVDNNIYLNREALSEKKVAVDVGALTVASDLMTRPEIAAAFTRDEMLTMVPGSTLQQKMKRSFHRDRSGDIVLALKPYYVEGRDDGTNHGQPYDYDAHVPLIFVGEGIRPGIYRNEASPVDIGPTLSALLGISSPAGGSGRVLEEALQ